MLKSRIYGLLLCLVVLTAARPVMAQSGDCDPEPALRMITTDLDGAQVNFYMATMSGNGRYVAYDSSNDNIVPNDTNETSDIFIYDRLDCSTRRVSVNAQGEEGNSFSYPGKLSDDGRYLLLYANATNFHPGYPGDPSDDSGQAGVFLLDLNTQQFEYLGLHASLVGDMSADGRYVVFSTEDQLVPADNNISVDMYVYDRVNETYQWVSEGVETVYGDYAPGISADGAYIAFATSVPIFPEDDNEDYDVFLYERATGNLEIISTSPQGVVGNADSVDWPTLSADGRYVTFQSLASNLLANDNDSYDESTDVFSYDRITDEITCISVNEVGQCGYGWAQNYRTSMSGDGRYVLYQWSDLNPSYGTNAAFLIYDRILDETHRISVTEDGQPIETEVGFIPTKTQYLSNDGRWAIFFGTGGLYLTDWQQLLQLPVSEPDAAPVRNRFDETAPVLTWSVVTWAAGYEIQIDDDANFSSPDYSTTVAADVLEIMLLEDDLVAGIYYWRVRAQRANGTWGDWSAADEFAYRVNG